MFTLKLYRRKGPETTQKMHKVIAVHRAVVLDIGEKGGALEIHAYVDQGGPEIYYIGEPEPGMDAHGRDDLHLGTEPYSWWGWGLLENQDGKTSEHYRPAGYG